MQISAGTHKNYYLWINMDKFGTQMIYCFAILQNFAFRNAKFSQTFIRAGQHTF